MLTDVRTDVVGRDLHDRGNVLVRTESESFIHVIHGETVAEWNLPARQRNRTGTMQFPFQ